MSKYKQYTVFVGMPEVGYSFQEWTANALLIAAAPELLDALDQIEKIANAFQDPKTARVQIMNIARAAIAKATS